MSATYTVNGERSSAAGVEAIGLKGEFAVRIEQKDVFEPEKMHRASAYFTRSELEAFRDSLTAALEGK